MRLSFRSLIAAGSLAVAAHAAPKTAPINPDFTKGEARPAKAKHDWNLGPTGARGWMFCDEFSTTDARQISITQVDKGSPADGTLDVNDVLLGVRGQLFSHDPREELGRAITAAEAADGGLKLTRWRAGKTEQVQLKLAPLGSYSPTAPFSCPKSKRVLERGIQELAERMQSPHYAKHLDPIVRSINALAILASGNASLIPLAKKEAIWASGYHDDSFQTWRYGYVMMLLAEYAMATGDSSVLPGLKRLALEAANGQSAVGSWGHGFALPSGRLGGYGMMNAPGLPLTIALVLAREAGVKEPAVDKAIELSARLLRFYEGKGAIPYGDHHPWTESHEDNGKCGMAATLFNLLGEARRAEFFARMSLASHGPERDGGHTGNFFNMLWATPGVGLSGPQATGAWMNEFGGWYFDLARRWNGSFAHLGPPEPDNDSYHDWDASGAYLLAHALPLRSLRCLGKSPSIVPQLDARAAQAIINDGRGWSSKDRKSAYDALTQEELLARLGSWSPVVRERAALAYARRKDAGITPLLSLLEGTSLHAKYGACQACAELGGRAAPAMDLLAGCLDSEDLWLRIKAAEAVCKLGSKARLLLPKLLQMLAANDTTLDPRSMQQRYLSFALFDSGGLLRRSLEGVDLPALLSAVRAGLQNQDGRARGSIASVYRQLSTEQIQPLLPAIYKAIKEPAPSGEMFADEIRLEGLRVLALHRVEEGIAACVTYAREQNQWSSENRTPELMKILLAYGAHAKRVLPELAVLARYFGSEEKNFPKHLMARKAQCVTETIQAIEAATETPVLVPLPR
jgi:hypothetical protein